MFERRGSHFSSKGDTWAAVSAGVLLRNEQASISARTDHCQPRSLSTYRGVSRTSQPINGPLFELLECDLGRRGNFIEAQAVRVVQLFVRGSCELFSLVVNCTSPFAVNSIVILSNHDSFGLC